MSPEDKQTLKDAFKKALDRDPVGADTPFTLQGVSTPVTHRQLIENTLRGENFFDSVEQGIKNGNGTLSDYVKKIEDIKFPQPKR